MQLHVCCQLTLAEGPYTARQVPRCNRPQRSQETGRNVNRMVPHMHSPLPLYPEHMCKT